VVDFQIAKEIQARVDFLADRANEALLTDDERAEYERYISASDLIAILQLKVQRFQQRNERR
jgi:hypothetical protein